jgi:hypothetical protein
LPSEMLPLQEVLAPLLNTTASDNGLHFSVGLKFSTIIKKSAILMHRWMGIPGGAGPERNLGGHSWQWKMLRTAATHLDILRLSPGEGAQVCPVCPQAALMHARCVCVCVCVRACRRWPVSLGSRGQNVACEAGMPGMLITEIPGKCGE